jgi:5-deoxy-glucuronate isomerase
MVEDLALLTAVTDYLYLPRESAATITSAGGGRFAIPTARATRRLEASLSPGQRSPGGAARR